MIRDSPTDMDNIIQRGPYDVILANPPYIPNPDKGTRALHQYGDGGPSGEEVTKTIIKCLPRALKDDGWLYLVANLVNVTDLPKRLLDWWGQVPENNYHCQMAAYYGIRWPSSEYASLIYNRAPATDPAVIHYTKALENGGVKDLCNGFVFARVTTSSATATEEKEGDIVTVVYKEGNRASARFVVDQIWQAVAMGGSEAEKVKDTLAQGWQ